MPSPAWTPRPPAQRGFAQADQVHQLGGLSFNLGLDPGDLGPAIAPVIRPAAPRGIRSEGSATEKGEMKSKISIWDCRRAIEIKGGLPLTMRGDLFDIDRPSAASVARWPPVKLLVTQLEVKQGQWIAENIVFTRSGQEYLTKLARDIIADNDRLYAAHQSDLDGED